MPLSALHVLHVCKLDTEKQCKYLLQDELDEDMFQCLKMSSQKNIAEEIVNLGRSGVKEKIHNDNCPGFPIFRHKILGYDQKNS